MDEDRQSEAKGTGVVGEAFSNDVVADGDDGAVDSIDTNEGGEFFYGTQDGDTVDFGAVELGIVIDEAGDGANSRAIHKFDENASLSACTVDDDCHVTPAFLIGRVAGETIKQPRRQTWKWSHGGSITPVAFHHASEGLHR
jgi:hypothetical protein